MTKTISTGFSIIEIIIAAAIFLSVVAAFVFSHDVLREISADSGAKTTAALLLEEGAEALVLLKDLDWDTEIAAVPTDSVRYLHWQSGSYELSSSTVLISGNFERHVTFYEAHRSGAGAYAESGTIDSNTRRARIEIWEEGGTEVLVAAEMLIHNLDE